MTSTPDAPRRRPWIHRPPVLRPGPRPAERRRRPANHRFALPAVHEIPERRVINGPERTW